MELDRKVLERVKAFQRNEITGCLIYQELAAAAKNPATVQVLEEMAANERRHYQFWKNLSGVEMKPDRWQVKKYEALAHSFGFPFCLRLLTREELSAKKAYDRVLAVFPDAQSLIDEEARHEKRLQDLVQEQAQGAGLSEGAFIVQRLNESLTELIGTFAGLTFALQDNQLIVLAGLIAGFAVTFSRASSAHFFKKLDGAPSRALMPSLSVGAIHLVTVLLLVLPFLALPNSFGALGITLALGVVLTFFFEFYIAVAKGLDFLARLKKAMTVLLGCAAVSFALGRLLGLLLEVAV